MSLKERILHESLRQFSTKGFLATSISDIMDGARTSKGGLYNHFRSKDELFHAALTEARSIWRERNLEGIAQCDRPLDKLIRLLENYKDRYLTDTETLPGGCIFVSLSVELSDPRPDLACEVNEGFTRLKAMMEALLLEENANGNLRPGFTPHAITQMVFSGLIGACVMYTADRSRTNLDAAIGALIAYLRMVVSPSP